MKISTKMAFATSALVVLFGLSTLSALAGPSKFGVTFTAPMGPVAEAQAKGKPSCADRCQRRCTGKTAKCLGSCMRTCKN